MKKYFYLAVMILISIQTKAQIVDVSVYQDCRKNGYIEVITPKVGTADVKITSDRTSCEWVQLWENGPRWAMFNVGATITDYSRINYYSDATSFLNYQSESAYYNTANVGGLYAWNNPNLNGRKTTWNHLVNTGIGDVATALWGDNWKTPTYWQLDTLQDSTYTSWIWCDGSTTQYVSGCILKGYKVSGVGDYANCSIFLPAAGLFDYSERLVAEASIWGHYWSSESLCRYVGSPCIMRCDSSTHIMFYENCKRGLSVRAVLAP